MSMLRIRSQNFSSGICLYLKKTFIFALTFHPFGTPLTCHLLVTFNNLFFLFLNLN